jgi:pSer/pThr/pTyr-binding forkhead associated (FHA) protein
MSLQLLVTAGPDAGRVFTLHPGDDNILGRGRDALYQVNDPRTSRAHCQVVREGDRVTVVCLGGSRGTFVNGKPVQKQALKPGDKLRVGDTQMRLQGGGVLKLLAKRPEDRYASAAELLKELERVGRLNGVTV